MAKRSVKEAAALLGVAVPRVGSFRDSAGRIVIMMRMLVLVREFCIESGVAQSTVIEALRALWPDERSEHDGDERVGQIVPCPSKFVTGGRIVECQLPTGHEGKHETIGFSWTGRTGQPETRR